MQRELRREEMDLVGDLLNITTFCLLLGLGFRLGFFVYIRSPVAANLGQGRPGVRSPSGLCMRTVGLLHLGLLGHSSLGRALSSQRSLPAVRNDFSAGS